MIRKLFAAAALFSLVVTASVSAEAADGNTILAVKDAAAALDIAFENQDADAIKDLMTTDHIAATPYYAAAFDVDALLGTLDVLTYTITSASAADVSLVGPDAAVVTQEKTYTGTFKGKAVPARVYASALWVKQDGHWLEKLYQETQIAE